jgi:outer membrane biosynthesis protein TonB
MSTETIDIETTSQPQTMAVERRGETGVGKALSIDELSARLKFVRDVMRQEMKEGTDYGVIPGTGQKPTLLQPGAQKLLLTFNLTEEVKKEVLREYPDMHREYEFTVTVCAANGKRWDGVGTCSTLETKYRYRKAERVCPTCGKKALIAENPKFLQPGEVPGWICWKKKSGCGTRFRKDHPGIAQDAEPTANPDPADCWNTVRKMAFKRALVAAAINATNTSELWTQDLEEGAEPAENTPKPPKTPQDKKAGVSTPPPAARPQQPPATAASTSQKPATAPTGPRFATEKTRDWMIRQLDGAEDIALEYFRNLEKPAVLLENEQLKDVPFEWVPMSREQMKLLDKALRAFANGDPPVHPYPPNPIKEEEKQRRVAAAKPKPAPAPAAKPVEVPRDENCDPNSPSAPWRSFPFPFGKSAGRKLADVDKKYLFGFWANYKVEETFNGKPRRPETIAKDTRFRQMLDEAGKHYEFGKPRDAQPDTAYSKAVVTDGSREAELQAELAAEQDGVPF